MHHSNICSIYLPPSERFSLVYIYDRHIYRDNETGYYRFNDIIPPIVKNIYTTKSFGLIKINTDYESFKEHLTRSNELFKEWFNKHKRELKQYDHLIHYNDIKTDDPSIWDSFFENKTSIFYYSEDNCCRHLQNDIYEGYYIREDILPIAIQQIFGRLYISSEIKV